MHPTRYVPMPKSGKYPEGYNLPLKDRVLVVVGANGSGKTRFGAWLDWKNPKKHHRVSAHRALSFPDRVQPMDMREAELQLYAGDHQATNFDHIRRLRRWNNNPATALLNDFEPLVTLMVSESFEISDKYRTAMQREKQYVPPPETRLDLVKQIWESILPTRELSIAGNRIEVQNRKSPKRYHPKEMSDGERGIFYLIGEALSAPKDGVFIVDEPELHLHRAIQARLWDAIEQARPDCTFVYITHDLGFAASRKDATKVWLREYADDSWDWEIVPDSEALPETLLLEVIGSRRPVLFVEGERGKLEYFIYGKAFPEYTVIPCGSCETVIHSTKSFNEMGELHHNRCTGLVDNDGRSPEDVAMLEAHGVRVLPVALVENIFLTEPVLVLAAAKLGLKSEEVLPKIQTRVFAQLERNKIHVVSNLARQEIEIKLRRFGKGDDGLEGLRAAFANACSNIKPDEIYKRWEQEVEEVLTKKNYEGALRYYKTKGLAAEAGAVLGVKYQEQVLRWMRSDHASDFVTAIRNLLEPVINLQPEAARG